MINKYQKITLMLMGLSGLGATAMAAESTTYTYDDWQVTCQQGKDKSNNCAMSQQGVDKKSGHLIYQVAIAAPKRNGPKKLDVLVPLGVLLPSGVTIAVDKGADSTFKLAYRYCAAAGCVAETTVGKKITTLFRGGHKAELRIRNQDRKKITLPLSLKGFSKAFSKLEANNKH